MRILTRSRQVRTAGAFRKAPASEATAQVLLLEAAEILGIGELLQRRPRQLSGGQRQRVALGRAIVRHPREAWRGRVRRFPKSGQDARCAPEFIKSADVSRIL